MYEEMTYERILQRMLDAAPDTIDKREGSIFYDAVAPAAFELAEAYIMARVILKQSFITTADREFLIDHANDFSITPKPASPAVVEAKFNMALPIGTRFNSGALNFAITNVLDDTAHKYELTCETAGEDGNYCIGDILPITQIASLEYARITKVITPGEDEEDTEVFRERVKQLLKSDAYGGNRDDYHEKLKSIAGVGGVKTWRCWDGGGTVKVVFITSEYKSPDTKFVQRVQTMLDPEVNQGTGEGIAPVGHTVTVEGAKAVDININATLMVSSGQPSDYVEAIKTAVDRYISEQRKEWASQDNTTGVVIRAAFVLAAILTVKNVVDVTNITVNGHTDRVDIPADSIPVLGEVTV